MVSLFALALALASASFVPRAAGAPVTTEKATNGLITFAVAADQPVETHLLVDPLVAEYDLFTVNPDGTALQALRQGPQADFDPVWSPDGTKIAFSSCPRFALASDIFVMDSDGSNVTNITNSPLNDDVQPNWSPDGDQLVYRSALSPAPTTFALESGDLYVMNADGTGSHLIYAAEGIELHPTWSPSGDWIAFVSEEALQLVKPNGGAHLVLPDVGRGRPLGPEWSPDGDWLAFSNGIFDGVTGDYAGFDMWVTKIPGFRMRNLTKGNRVNEVSPAWSPDGTKIAFLSDREGPFQLYVMNTNGSEVRRIVDIDLSGSRPDWGPRP